LLVLAVAAGLDVTAVHVDHCLRPGSDREADVVAETAAWAGARFEARRAPVAEGPNLEARARAARYGALPPGALTGHTADDLAETVLLHLLRGAGLDGVAAMTTDHRPLLGLRRAETAVLCRQLGLATVEDPSNHDPRFRRNRVRHEVLPLLDDVAGRDVAALLARTARLVADDVALLDELAAALDATDATQLAAAPPALARRAVRRWLRGEHPPSSAAVERVMAVAAGRALATEIEGGRRVWRSGGRLHVSDG
jgi:tRNA(Ile)-lysidine synthase